MLMLVRIILLLSFLLMSAGSLEYINANESELDVDPPKYEHRSVWVATVPGMDFLKTEKEQMRAMGMDIPEGDVSADWPKEEAQSAEEHKEDLIEIIDNAYDAGMNAVIFQVVPRGNAFYESERLPWSHTLDDDNEAGVHPGWDPLETAIEEAHKRGMELHAWYNVGRVGDDGMPLPDEEPYHISQTNEEWLQHIGNQLWLDPGIPDAREWMEGNVMEIVENYDVDAIHFDFIRYPTGGFDSDSDTMDEYNPDDIEDLDDWRRNNLTSFVENIYPQVKEEKPWVKVGSAALGHYKSEEVGWAGAWGYEAAFQETREWLEMEIHDYLAPMIYWDIHWPNPRFEVLAHLWADDRRGRHVYLGTGPYQGFDTEEISAQIDTSRVADAQGNIHFSYRDVFPIVGDRVVDERYQINASIIPPMEWMDTDVPEAPELSIDEPVARQHPEGAELQEDEQVVNLQWNDQDFETEEGDDLIRYAVYRYNGDAEPDKEDVQEDAMSLVGITGETEYTDIAPPAAHDNFYYYVSALNRNNNESDLSNPAETEVLVSSDDEPELASEHRLHQNYPNPFNPVTEISYELASEAEVELTVYDVTGREVVTLKEGTVQSAGTHTARFDGSDLASGIYLYRLEVRDAATGADLHTDTRRMTLIK